MYLRCGNQILKSLPSPSSPFLPCFSLNPPASITHLLPALLLSLIEFNSAQGDSVIDRLREREKTKTFFFTMLILCQIFFFFLFTVPWALQLIASSKLNHHHPPPPPSSLLPSTPSHPTEPWPATAAWPDVKEKEREDKERWRTERGHLLRGMSTETERMEKRRQRESCREKRGDVENGKGVTYL